MHDPHDLDGAPLPHLRELLDSNDPAQRSDAACALGDRLRSREVSSLDPEIVEALASRLTDSVPIVQFEAAVALAEMHDTRATDVLLKALSFRTLRLDATRALGTLGDPRAAPALTRILERWLYPWADKLQAAAALCALGDARGATYLKTKLDSGRLAERAAAVHFIGESRHPEARAILEGILSDATHPMRDVAARALGLLGDPATRVALESARHSADEELKDDIEQALALLARAVR